MKRIVTLIFLLFFALAGCCNDVHAIVHTDGNYFSTHAPIKKIQPLEITPPLNYYTSNSSLNSTQPVDFLCIEEDDDQDDVNKPVSASRYFIAFFLSNPNSVFTNSLPFYRSLFYTAPGKYITLRSLRI